VKYKGVHYALTSLVFGLSCAPRIMISILGKVLSLDDRVFRPTDRYIDDIVVQESMLRKCASMLQSMGSIRKSCMASLVVIY